MRLDGGVDRTHRHAARAAEWDALDPSGHPFVRHAFLAALEATGCVGGDTGWAPRHLVLRDEDRPARRARCPPTRSSIPGANSSSTGTGRRRIARLGLDYYPKLLCGDPVHAGDRPASAARRRSRLRSPRREALATTRCSRRRADHGLSGAHVNFTTPRRSGRARGGGLSAPRGLPVPVAQPRLPRFRRLSRRASAPTSARSCERERRRVAEAGVSIRYAARRRHRRRLCGHRCSRSPSAPFCSTATRITSMPTFSSGSRARCRAS